MYLYSLEFTQKILDPAFEPLAAIILLPKYIHLQICM